MVFFLLSCSLQSEDIFSLIFHDTRNMKMYLRYSLVFKQLIMWTCLSGKHFSFNLHIEKLLTSIKSVVGKTNPTNKTLIQIKINKYLLVGKMIINYYQLNFENCFLSKNSQNQARLFSVSTISEISGKGKMQMKDAPFIPIS